MKPSEFPSAGLAYKPIPLPDRHSMSDGEMARAARAFHTFMRTRHTVRDFSDRAVSRDVIEDCVRTAATAPSGANRQPWYFVAISDPAVKAQIRKAAEDEEQRFYAGAAGDSWLNALRPLGTDAEKPHLEAAPWLIVVFAQRSGCLDDGSQFKHYYVTESVGIAAGFLLAALHHAGLATLTHTPNPMKFLNRLLNRTASEKPLLIIAAGHPSEDATIPAAATIKKPLDEILAIL